MTDQECWTSSYKLEIEITKTLQLKQWQIKLDDFFNIIDRKFVWRKSIGCKWKRLKFYKLESLKVKSLQFKVKNKRSYITAWLNKIL